MYLTILQPYVDNYWNIRSGFEMQKLEEIKVKILLLCKLSHRIFQVVNNRTNEWGEPIEYFQINKVKQKDVDM